MPNPWSLVLSPCALCRIHSHRISFQRASVFISLYPCFLQREGDEDKFAQKFLFAVPRTISCCWIFNFYVSNFSTFCFTVWRKRTSCARILNLFYLFFFFSLFLSSHSYSISFYLYFYSHSAFGEAWKSSINGARRSWQTVLECESRKWSFYCGHTRPLTASVMWTVFSTMYNLVHTIC